ncbi:uncharacterized protein LOC143076690 [Mytilus galloprovincialis]|uniref:uncharacterized protein LOC143076690 n=1 Tax=Mytilus galloprovincialis TaxID=29158 RepID=UPI003F7BEC11
MDMAMSCGVSPFCSVCGILYNALRCLQELEKECGNKRKRRDVSSDVVNNFIVTSKPMNNFRLMMDEIFGHEQMFSVKKEWYPAFKTVTSDDSENGSNLSKDEKSFVLNTLTSDISKPILDRFLERWNNTVSAWYNGTLNHEIKIGGVINLSKLSMMTQQYIKDTKTASYRGFDSIFSDFDHALNAYVLAEKETQQEGSNKKDGAICAKVRVRIVQDLVLTRDAFNARFEIENGENSALESIHVEIEIKHNTGSGEIVNGLFSIGDPDLLGLTGVDGDGRLGVDLSGSAEWLIIPYSIAAPNGDVLFNVGGRLSYRVGGSNFSVPLLPDTITVKPNPSLVLHYFHEKYVRGDDPLTEEKEPVIPFTLAVMVMNSGYGLARALKISSAQPQIIENEKGLLITFRIVGGFLGNEPISPSLIVDFGDIQSFETKTARWMLTSTLQGTFYNFSATFENINPLGDPQLSLFENIWYHELIHLVRLFRDEQADGFDDFLVNDFVDNKGIPEKVYNSANGSDVYNVMTATVLGLSSSTFVKSNMKTYTLVCMEVLTKTSNWFYARIKNNVTSPDQTLLDVRSDDNRSIVVDKNIWTTTHILDSFLIHLFDYIKNNDSVAENTKMKYFLTFGPKNTHPPKFNKTSYSITISPETPKGKPILTVHAYDVDKNEITYDLVGLSQGSFDVDPHNGVVTLLNIPLAVGVFELQIICRDDGIPSLSGVVHVNIHVISGEKITTTLITYSETSAPISVTSKPNNSVSDKTTMPTSSSGALDMTTKLSNYKTTEQDTSTGVVYATTNSLSDETTYHDTSKVVVDTTSKSSFGKTTEQDTSTYSVDAISGSPGTNIPEPDTSAIVVDSSTLSSSDRKTEPAISSGKVDATTKSSTTVDRFTLNNAVEMTSKSSFRKTSIPHSSTTAFGTTLGTSSAVKQTSHILFLIGSNVLILSLKLID